MRVLVPIVLLLTGLTISKLQHAQISRPLSGPTFWLVWAVLGWHYFYGGGIWQVAGPVGRQAGRCLASSFPVLHASILGGTLHVCASCPALPAAADLCPFRKPERESLGHVRGHVVTGKQRCCPIMSAIAGRPFRDAGRERKVCAGICAHLFAVRTSPWFPVTSAVTSTVTLYCGTTAQHTAQGTCVHVSANLAAKPTPSFVSAMLPNLK